MSFDLIVKGGTLPDGTIADIGIKGETIAAIEPRLEAEALLLMLSERGVCASAGAACSSGSLDPSPVLLAMGIPEPIAHGSLRFSISRHTTETELTDAAATIAECAARLRASL